MPPNTYGWSLGQRPPPWPFRQRLIYVYIKWIFGTPDSAELCPGRTMDFIKNCCWPALCPGDGVHSASSPRLTVNRGRKHEHGKEAWRGWVISLKAGVRSAAAKQRVSDTPASGQGRSPGTEPCTHGHFPQGPLFLWPSTRKVGGLADTKAG